MSEIYGRFLTEVKKLCTRGEKVKNLRNKAGIYDSTIRKVNHLENNTIYVLNNSDSEKAKELVPDVQRTCRKAIAYVEFINPVFQEND